MKKYLLAAAMLVILQVGLLVGGTAAVIAVRGDCQQSGMFKFQWLCGESKTISPETLPIVFAVLLPPLIVAWSLSKFRTRISWKRLGLLYVLTTIFVYMFILFFDRPTCACM